MKKEMKLNASARKFLARTKLSHSGLFEQKPLRKISSQSVTTAQDTKSNQNATFDLCFSTPAGGQKITANQSSDSTQQILKSCNTSVKDKNDKIKSFEKGLHSSFWQQSFNTVKDIKCFEEKNKDIFINTFKIIQKSVKDIAFFLKDQNLVINLIILLNKVVPALTDKLYFESMKHNIFYWDTGISNSLYTSILAACNSTLKSYSTPPTPIGDAFTLCNNETVEIISDVMQAKNDTVQRCINGQLCSSGSGKTDPMVILILVAVIVTIITLIVKACCKKVYRHNPDGSFDAEPTYQCRC
jgi:hypothetical protein